MEVEATSASLLQDGVPQESDFVIAPDPPASEGRLSCESGIADYADAVPHIVAGASAPTSYEYWPWSEKLFLGESQQVMTSDAGMYGENKRSSMSVLVALLKEKHQLREDSVFCDIGSGRGVPSITCATWTNVGASIGVEMDEGCFHLSLKHTQDLLVQCVEHQAERGENPLTQPPPLNIGFLLADATTLKTFDPVTHMFSFDLAMPGYMIDLFVELFNKSETCFIYISFRKNLTKFYSLNADLVDKVTLNMQGSGEKHCAFVYRKRDFKVPSKLKNLQAEALKKRSVAADNFWYLVKQSYQPTASQLWAVQQKLQRWLGHSNSRRDPLKSKRKAEVMFRHKLLEWKCHREERLAHRHSRKHSKKKRQDETGEGGEKGTADVDEGAIADSESPPSSAAPKSQSRSRQPAAAAAAAASSSRGVGRPRGSQQGRSRGPRFSDDEDSECSDMYRDENGDFTHERYRKRLAELRMLREEAKKEREEIREKRQARRALREEKKGGRKNSTKRKEKKGKPSLKKGVKGVQEEKKEKKERGPSLIMGMIQNKRRWVHTKIDAGRESRMQNAVEQMLMSQKFLSSHHPDGLGPFCLPPAKGSEGLLKVKEEETGEPSKEGHGDKGVVKAEVVGDAIDETRSAEPNGPSTVTATATATPPPTASEGGNLSQSICPSLPPSPLSRSPREAVKGRDAEQFGKADVGEEGGLSSAGVKTEETGVQQDSSEVAPVNEGAAEAADTAGDGGGEEEGQTNVPTVQGGEAQGEEENEIEPCWIQCDRCDKWRLLVEGLCEEEKKSTSLWLCEMNPDVLHSCCSQPEEGQPTREEVEWALNRAERLPGQKNFIGEGTWWDTVESDFSLSSLSPDSLSSSSSESEEEEEEEEGEGRISTWVMCEKCNKWRRLPSSGKGSRPGKGEWYCSKNPDKRFAKCSQPQEEDNHEIALSFLKTQTNISDSFHVKEEEIARKRRVKPSKPVHASLFFTGSRYTRLLLKEKERERKMLASVGLEDGGGELLFGHESSDFSSDSEYAFMMKQKKSEREEGRKSLGAFTSDRLFNYLSESSCLSSSSEEESTDEMGRSRAAKAAVAASSSSSSSSAQQNPPSPSAVAAAAASVFASSSSDPLPNNAQLEVVADARDAVMAEAADMAPASVAPLGSEGNTAVSEQPPSHEPMQEGLEGNGRDESMGVDSVSQEGEGVGAEAPGGTEVEQERKEKREEKVEFPVLGVEGDVAMEDAEPGVASPAAPALQPIPPPRDPADISVSDPAAPLPVGASPHPPPSYGTHPTGAPEPTAAETGSPAPAIVEGPGVEGGDKEKKVHEGGKETEEVGKSGKKERPRTSLKWPYNKTAEEQKQQPRLKEWEKLALEAERLMTGSIGWADYSTPPDESVSLRLFGDPDFFNQLATQKNQGQGEGEGEGREEEAVPPSPRVTTRGTPYSTAARKSGRIAKLTGEDKEARKEEEQRRKRRQRLVDGHEWRKIQRAKMRGCREERRRLRADRLGVSWEEFTRQRNEKKEQRMAEKEAARQRYLQQQQERWEKQQQELEAKRKQEEEERVKLIEREAKRQKKREETAEKRRQRKEAQEEQARKEAEKAAQRARREAEAAAEKKRKRAEATARRKAREAEQAAAATAEAAAAAASVTAASSQSPSELPGISPAPWGSFGVAAAAAKAKALISEAGSGASPTVEGEQSPVSSEHPLEEVVDLAHRRRLLQSASAGGAADQFVVKAQTATAPESESRVAFRKRKSPPQSPKAERAAEISEEQLASMQGLTRSRRRASVRFSNIMDSMRGGPGGAGAIAKTKSEDQQQQQAGDQSDLPSYRRPVKKVKQEEKEERDQQEGRVIRETSGDVPLSAEGVALMEDGPPSSADLAAAAPKIVPPSSHQPCLPPHFSSQGPQQQGEGEGREWRRTLADSSTAPAGQSGYASDPYQALASLSLPIPSRQSIVVAAAPGTALRGVPLPSSLYAARVHPHPLSGGNPSHQIRPLPDSFQEESTLRFGRPSGGLVGGPAARLSSAHVQGGAFASSGGYAHPRGGVGSEPLREPTRSPQVSRGPPAVGFSAAESRVILGGFPRGGTCVARVPIEPRPPQGSPAGRQMPPSQAADPTEREQTAPVSPAPAPLSPLVVPSAQQAPGGAE